MINVKRYKVEEVLVTFCYVGGLSLLCLAFVNSALAKLFIFSIPIALLHSYREDTFEDARSILVSFMIMGPFCAIIYLYVYFMSLEYTKRSFHRGYFIPTKAKDQEYMSKILSGKIKPWCDSHE